MSINHPSQKPIRLPFSVPKPGLSQAPKRICGICHKKDSNYTCPRCNVAYCSLKCFQDETHAQCSEPFYKATILDEIAADGGTGQNEKRNMLDMLRRFEQAQAEGDEALSELEREVDAEDELAAALKGVDLDTIDSNQLFHLLPQAHRDTFLKALKDPESKEAQALLEAANQDERDGPNVLPWWERPEILESEETEESYAEYPEMVEDSLLQGINPPTGTGSRLVYNVVAVVFTYFHVLLSFRLPSLGDSFLEDEDIDGQDIKHQFTLLLPFLGDPKSAVLFKSAREAWSAVWENIGKDLTTPTTDLLIRLMSMVPPMLHPSLEADKSPSILLVLSDLYQLFSRPKVGAAVPRKLLFYIAAMRRLSRSERLKVEREVEAEVRKLRGELQAEEPDGREDDRPALKIG